MPGCAFRPLSALLLVGVFFLGACGDDSSSDDMSAPNDLSVLMPKDLSVAAGFNCYQVVSCAQGCAGVQTCIDACIAKATAQAAPKFSALYARAYGACMAGGASVDGGAAACTSTSDTSGPCRACVGATTQSQGACGAQFTACLAP